MLIEENAIGDQRLLAVRLKAPKYYLNKFGGIETDFLLNVGFKSLIDISCIRKSIFFRHLGNILTCFSKFSWVIIYGMGINIRQK